MIEAESSDNQISIISSRDRIRVDVVDDCSLSGEKDLIQVI